MSEADKDLEEAQHFISLGTKELEIIQRKIDKIGDFKFKVKAWAITLVLASLLGGKSANLGDFTAATLVIIPILLWNLETSIDKQGKSFGKRAKDLEREIYLTHRRIEYCSKLKISKRTPALATWILCGGLKITPSKTAGWVEKILVSIQRRAEGIFYFTLIVATVAWPFLQAPTPKSPPDKISPLAEKPIPTKLVTLPTAETNKAVKNSALEPEKQEKSPDSE